MASEQVVKLAERMCLEVAKSERFWRDLGPEPWAAVLLGVVTTLGVVIVALGLLLIQREKKQQALYRNTTRCPACVGTGRVAPGPETELLRRLSQEGTGISHVTRTEDAFVGFLYAPAFSGGRVVLSAALPRYAKGAARRVG